MRLGEGVADVLRCLVRRFSQERKLHCNSSAHGVILMASKTFRLCWVVTYSPLLQCTAIYAHTRPSGVEVGTRWDEWEGILDD
jgi:hypothetical protein